MANISLGYTLSSEEFSPQQLVANAAQAEKVGFTFLGISDHYFPWVDQQGQASFVWAVLGAISEVTTDIPIFTGVTCPLIRVHPAIIAQAAATAACLFEGRFSLGVGTGENLNEHIVGQGWPNIAIRQEMLEEAVSIIRQLWEGQLVNQIGGYYSVDQAKLYTLPDQTPPLLMAAGGPESAELAGRLADGLISTAPSAQIVDTFNQTGGASKPKYAQASVCYHPDEQRAKEIALKAWPNAAISG